MEMNSESTELNLNKESIKGIMNNHRMQVALLGYRLFCDAYYETTTPKILSRIGLPD